MSIFGYRISYFDCLRLYPTTATSIADDSISHAYCEASFTSPVFGVFGFFGVGFFGSVCGAGFALSVTVILPFAATTVSP